MADTATIQLIFDTSKAIKSAEQFGVALEKSLGVSKTSAKNFASAIDTLTKKAESLEVANKELASLRGQLGASTRAYNTALKTGTEKDQISAKEKLTQIQGEYNAKAAETKRLTYEIDKELSKLPYTEKEILACQQQINASVSSYQQKIKQSGTTHDESLKKMSGNANAAQLSFKELAARIYNLRRGGKDATVEFSELSRRLNEFKPSSANLAETDKFLQDIGDAIKFIKKDLTDRNVIDDVFNRLKEASVTATKAQADLNAEIKRGVSDEQSEVNLAYALLETVRQIEAAREAETAQYNANAVLAYTAALRQAREEEKARIEQAQQDRTAEVAQHNLNYINALTGALAQMRAEQKAALDQALAEQQAKQAQDSANSVLALASAYKQVRAEQQALLSQALAEQQAQQNRDTVNSTYALLAAYKQVRAEEKARIEQERQAQIAQNNRDAVNSIFALVEAEKNFRAEIVAVKADVRGVADAIKADPAQNNLAELIRRYQALSEAKKQMESMGLPKELDGTYATTVQLLAQLNGQINAYKKNLAGADANNKSGAKSTNTFANAIRFLDKSVRAVKSGFSTLRSVIKNVKSAFDKMSHSMTKDFKHLISYITRYIFGFRSLFFLVRRLRRYIGEGIKNMAQFNEGNNHVNESITRLLSSLLYLKNAWATAFSPILQFVTPWLETLIDSLAAAGNAFSRFLGSLLGQTTVFQAVKVDAQDYAESLDNAAGSAGSAADKTKKLTDRLAAFDDLNILGVDTDPDGSGSGGGGGGADAYVPDPNEMFKLVEVDNKNLLAALKMMWENSDFSLLGKIIKNKIMESLENIKWEEDVYPTVRRVMSSLGTFIVGLFGDPKFWEDLGEFGAGLFNAIIYGVQAFLETTKGIKFGEMIANGLNKLLTETDWEQAGLDVNELGNQILDNLIDFFDTMDAEKASAAITAFLEKANIPQLAVKVGELTISAGGFLVTTAGMSLGDLLWDWVNQNGTSGVVMTKDGVEIPFKLNFLDSLWGDGYFQSLVDKYPLLALIVKILEGPIEWLVSVGLELSGKYMDSETVQNFLDIFTGKYDFSNFFSDSGTDEFNSTMHNFNEQMDGASTKSKDTYDKIWENTESVKGAFSSLKGSLATTWSNTAADADTYWTNIKNNITDAVTTAKTTVSNKVTEWRTNLSQAWSNIKSDATSNFETMKSTIIETFEGLRDGIKNIINNGILPTVENMINFLIDGINSLIDKLNAFPDIEITNIFNGQTVDLGFSIPNLNHISIPRLAQGAVIPPNREFMAVLGDQSSGTNIEAPLDTIKQAVAEVMANNGNAEMIQLLQQLIAVVESKELNVGDKEIGQANARYTQRQNRIRGVNF